MTFISRQAEIAIYGTGWAEPRMSASRLWNCSEGNDMEVQPDFKELFELFNSHGVEYLIVGGNALAYLFSLLPSEAIRSLLSFG